MLFLNFRNSYFWRETEKRLVVESAVDRLLLSKATSSGPRINPAELKVFMNSGTSTPIHILSGWKDIASYLGKGVRTVQRYEEELRLPVRRPAGRTRGSVVATKSELDAWVAASPVREQLPVATGLGSRPAPFLAGIAQGLNEMRMLRAQMRELRSEMRVSVRLLQASIVELRGSVQEKSATDRKSQSLARLTPLGSDEFVYPKAS